MATVVMTTAAGEEHGLINTLTNSSKANDFKHFTPEHKAYLEKEKKNDARLVQAEYLNMRGRHERLTKHYCKYAGDPIQQWHFIPGHVYDVPLGLVNEVNDINKRLKKRSGLVSVNGNPVNNNESPLEKDEEGDWIHKFVSHGF